MLQITTNVGPRSELWTFEIGLSGKHVPARIHPVDYSHEAEYPEWEVIGAMPAEEDCQMTPEEAQSAFEAMPKVDAFVWAEAKKELSEF